MRKPVPLRRKGYANSNKQTNQKEYDQDRGENDVNE